MSKFLYRGGKWSPHAHDHRIVHNEAAEKAAVEEGFAPIDHSLTVKPDPTDAVIDVDAEVKSAGELQADDEAPAKPKRKPGVARGAGK